MGAAYFYHLTDSPLEQALPALLRRAQAAGWRVVVRGRNQDHLKWLDEKLWLGPEEAFEPHGLSGGPYDAEQPVLLTLGTERPNAAQCVMSVDGAEVSAEEATELDRACILFDGHDAAALDHARAQWKTLTGAGIAAQYWAQDDGRWQMKQQTG